MSAAQFVQAANAFLAALPPFSTQVNADVSTILTLSLLVSTSTTSLTIGTGSKSLTVQTAKAYLAGQTVRIYSTATPDNYMNGTVTSYTSGTGVLVVNVTSVVGSGTMAAWTVTLNGGLATTAEVLARALLAGSESQTFSVAAATAAAHAVRVDQIQGASLTAFTTGGTGTAFTLTPSPAITAYTANKTFDVIFNVACGAAPTLQISGVATPPNLVRQLLDGSYQNLAANDFPAGWQSRVKLVSATQALVMRLPPRTFIGSLTRDLTLASGAVAITGVGFRPSKVRFKAAVNGTAIFSIGESGGVGNCAYYSAYASTANAIDTANAIAALTASVAYQNAVATMNVDGFTLTWTKVGAPTGTLSIVYVAEE